MSAHKNIQEDLNIYKSVTYSLRAFNSINEYIIKQNYIDIEKNKTEIMSLNIYITYLEIIKEICHYVINKNENNYYYINYFEEYNITEKIETRLKIMKGNFNFNFIISTIKNHKNPIMKEKAFFQGFTESINFYISSKNDIMKEFEKIAKGTTTIISYFKLLSIFCNIIIKIIDVQNKLKGILKYSTISKGFLTYELDFQYSNDKINSKKDSEDSFLELANDILDKMRKNKNDKIKVKYKINFYFDEKNENFVETCSGNDVINFIQKKFYLISDFFTRFFNDNSLKMKILEDILDKSLYIKKLNENIIYNILEEKIFNYKINIHEEAKEKIYSSFFSSLFQENQNLLSLYIKNTFNDINQPNYEDLFFSIKQKIDKIIYNFLEPCLSFNCKIYDLLKIEKFPIIRGFNYHRIKNITNIGFHRYTYNNYVDLSEIISSN